MYTRCVTYLLQGSISVSLDPYHNEWYFNNIIVLTLVLRTLRDRKKLSIANTKRPEDACCSERFAVMKLIEN